jgi:hypothetical protein
MLLKMKVLAVGLAVGLLTSCAAHREIKCRFTHLDGQIHPVPPHSSWVKGYDACVIDIHILQEFNVNPGVGVEVNGTKQQKTVLYEMIMKPPKQPESDNPRLKVLARY